MEIIEFETPTVDEAGSVIQVSRGSAQMLVEHLGSESKLEMVLIPGGAFQMGSLPQHGEPEEQPRHFVSIQAFLLGRFLITQEQWEAVVGKKPACRFKGRNLPVDRVSWESALRFCQMLSRISGRHYHLPSEAQWEYACRAGTQTAFAFGKTLTTELANYVGEHTYLAEAPGLYRHCTTEGSTFPPNAFGMHDMHGNLWEWCEDCWREDYQAAGSDGSAYVQRNQEYHAARGGSWHEPPGNCRSATRIGFYKADGEEFMGMRIACELR